MRAICFVDVGYGRTTLDLMFVIVIVVSIGVLVVLWGAYLVDSTFLRLMQERVEEW